MRIRRCLRGSARARLGGGVSTIQDVDGERQLLYSDEISYDELVESR
jgi:hypothetical protein